MDELRGTVVAVSRNEMYSFSKPNRDRIILVSGLGVEGDVHAGVTVRHRSRVRADPAQPNLRQVHLIQAELFDEVEAKGYDDVPSGGLGENVTTLGLDLLGMPRGTVLRFGASSGEVPLTNAAPEGPGVASGDAALAGAVDAGAENASAENASAEDAGAQDVEAARGVLAQAREVTLDPASAAAVGVLEETLERELARRQPDGRPAVVLMGLRNPCAQINRFRSGLLKEVLGHDDNGNVVRRAGVMAVVLRSGEIRPGDVVTAELPARPHEHLEVV